MEISRTCSGIGCLTGGVQRRPHRSDGSVLDRACGAPFLCGPGWPPKLLHVDDDKTNEPNAPGSYVPDMRASTRERADPRAAPADVLRAALRLRIDQTSLRKVAREVGMSLGGFHGFLAGTDAHPATLRKVRAWYVREMARRREEESLPVDSATAEAALAVLLEDIPADLRADAEEAMRSALTEWCGEHGARPPVWVSDDG